MQSLLGDGWQVLDGEASAARWRTVRDVTMLAGGNGDGGAGWRLSVKPSEGPAVVAAIQENLETQAVYDWAGGLVWLRVPQAGDAGAGVIRSEVAALGGHATLIRASAATRAGVEVFHPEPAPLAAIARGLRAKFDPGAILNPGRMG